METRHRVLIVTGGFLNEKETSVPRALRKQLLQWRAAQAAWLDLKIKLVLAEPIVAGRLLRWLSRRKWSTAIREYFAHDDHTVTPELTEVVLMTLLRDAGIAFAWATIDDIFARRAWLERELDRCDCVFLSTTLLRDLSEVEPVVRRLQRQGVRVVLGGALGGLLTERFPGMPGVDLIAIGYGEMLVPTLAHWIRSGFRELPPPVRGRVEQRRFSTFVWSGVPDGNVLDFLPTPDWSLAQHAHGRRFPLVYYESVRGCPYRCNFCNYPYLFDDTRFRYKSAVRIADDWQRYVEESGAQFISCLDSLFTVPRQRLTALCEELIRRNIEVKWICYARADDLAQSEIASMMKEAGAVQVQIGIESGDQRQLDNMDKQCSVESNLRALRNCRSVGLTSVISLIVGFPGETQETLERTYRFLEQSQPDFYFLATFSTRAYNVPVLNDRNRARFELRTQTQLRTVAPYWQHATMSCADVGNHVRALHERLMRNGVSLNAALFYSGILRYRAEQRAPLLEFQRDVATRSQVLRWMFDRANALVDAGLRRDLARWADSSDAGHTVAGAPLPIHLDK
jgi:anaerobic magnesium-protoporphyrin IX monomethyl ester cyclase